MDFTKHILATLPDIDAQSLLKALQHEPIFGLRINPQKTTISYIQSQFTFLKPHPFVREGFISNHQKVSGNHPLHRSGAFYIQEPSAMVVANLWTIHPDDKILDLSAAPGGKSTQLSAHLNEEGLLIANDIQMNRAQILNENIERLGCTNAFVSSNHVHELTSTFEGYFDKVLLDAPCSGSGMFRKNQEIADDWSYEKVLRLQSIQKELILKSYSMLKKHGLLLYSTCSFSQEENEEVIQYLLKNTNATLVPLPSHPLFHRGIDMPEAIRLYPFLFPGEGHFAALIICNDDHPTRVKIIKKQQKPNIPAFVYDFFTTFLNISIDSSRLIINQNHVHYLPKSFPYLPQLKLLRSGLHLGEIMKNRFEPSHALALSSKPSDWKQILSFSSESEQIQQFLRGESFFVSTPYKGYVLVCCDTIPIGYGKIANGMLKNHLPKGLRIK